MRTFFTTFLLCCFIFPANAQEKITFSEKDTTSLNGIFALDSIEHLARIQNYEQLTSRLEQLLAKPNLSPFEQGLALVYTGSVKAKSDVKQGISILKNARKMFEQYHPENRTVLKYLLLSINDLSNAYVGAGDYSTALQLGEQVKEMATQGNLDFPLLAAYVNMTQSLSRMGQLDRADRVIDSALVFIENIDEQISETLVLKNKIRIIRSKATIHNVHGRRNAALEVTKEAVKLCENRPKLRSDYITLLNDLGVIYYYKIDYGKSAYYFELARSQMLEDEVDRALWIAQVTANLGLIYMLYEDYDKSAQYFDKAEKTLNQQFEPGNLQFSPLYFNKGLLASLQDKPKTSRDYFKRAHEIRKDKLGTNHSETAHALGEWAVAEFELGNLDEAIRLGQKALDTGEAVTDEFWEENVRFALNLSEFYRSKKDLEKSKQYIQKAYDHLGYQYERDQNNFDKINAPLLLFSVLFEEQDLNFDQYQQSGNLDLLEKDAEFYDRSKALLASLKLTYTDPDSKKKVIEKGHGIYERQLRSIAARHDQSKDQALLRDMFSVIENSRNTFLFESEMDKELVTKGVIPESLVQEQQTVSDSLQQIKNALEKTSTQDDSLYIQLVNKFDRWKQAYYTLTEKVSQEYPDYYQLKYQAPEVDVTAILQKIESDAMLLNTFFGNEKIYLLKATSEKLQLHVVEDSKTIKSDIVALHTKLKNKAEASEWQPLINRLSTKLLAGLNMETVATVDLIPDGILGYLPFGLLKTDDVDLGTKTIVYHWTALDFLKEQTPRKTDKAILVFQPNFDKDRLNKEFNFNNPAVRDELGPLSGAREEAEKIGELYDTEVVTGQQANETFFKENGKRFGVLHFATHALISDLDPGFSKLVFDNATDSIQDGYLHAFEIFGLALNADLVTLSACNTGIGSIQKGEGMASLGKAFAYAGCPNVIQSLWPVNDNSTAQLMELFYANLKKGQTKPVALHNAKQDFVATSPAKWQHPYHWVGFVYYGDNQPLQLTSGGWGNGWLWIGVLAVVLIGVLSWRSGGR